MPYVNNQGVRIHYKVTGEGPSLFLQHGFTGCIDGWYELGMVEKLKDDFELIMIDARGHGKSDKPHNPEDYHLNVLVSDIVAVLDELNFDKVHYMGYSMGGWIGFGMAKYAPSRLNSLLIGGAQPYGLNFQETRKILSRGSEVFVDFVESWGVYSPETINHMRKNIDVVALHAAMQDRLDMSDILKTIEIPCLLFVGDADEQYDLIKECAGELPDATLVSFPGLNHLETVLRSDLVAKEIKAFLSRF